MTTRIFNPTMNLESSNQPGQLLLATLIREHAQGSHPLDYKMYRHNEELTMRAQVVQEYRVVHAVVE